MPSDSADDGSQPDRAFESAEYLLFESLMHHLIEKGLCSKNDALSIVQTAAQVVLGRIEGVDGDESKRSFAALERTYESFQALPDRHGRPGLDADNVVPLRRPLHGDQPEFPSAD